MTPESRPTPLQSHTQTVGDEQGRTARSIKPASRRDDVFTQRLGDELVIYDGQSHDAHRLSSTAALIWEEADGHRTVTELSSALRQSMAPSEGPLSDETVDGLVHMALDELDRVGLLVRGVPRIGDVMTRREMIGVTAALLPVIASIAAPTPAMAQTFPTEFPFAAFNGTYVGPGTPGTPNLCGLGPGQTTITLNLSSAAGVGLGSMAIRHAGGTTFTVNPVTAIPVGPASVNVTGSTVVPGGYSTSNSFTFVRGSGNSATVSGAQQISYPECGTTPYNITGTRQ
jgi:hypothetical protein